MLKCLYKLENNYCTVFIIPYSVLNDAYSDKWKVRAYYGDNSNEYEESGFFTVTRVPRTVSTPEDCEVLPGSSVNVSWTSNFLPVKAEIGYDSGYSDALEDVRNGKVVGLGPAAANDGAANKKCAAGAAFALWRLARRQAQRRAHLSRAAPQGCIHSR